MYRQIHTHLCIRHRVRTNIQVKVVGIWKHYGVEGMFDMLPPIAFLWIMPSLETYLTLRKGQFTLELLDSWPLKFKILHWLEVRWVISLNLHKGSLKANPSKCFGWKTFWNPIWIVVDNVGWALGYFFKQENSESLWVAKKSPLFIYDIL